MKQVYYNEEVSTILNEYLNYLFLLNLSLDNVVYVLDLKMNLPETSKTIHENVAHLYPEIGDTLSDFMIKSNILPQRTSLNYKEVTFEKLDVVVLEDGRSFLIVSELKEDYEEEVEVVILEIKEEDGEQVYDTLTDEDLLKDVYSRFLKQQGIEEDEE